MMEHDVAPGCGVLSAVFLCCAALSAFPEGLTSDPTFVSLRPEESSFWTTATNSTMALPVDYPRGATSATLRITGLGIDFTSSPVCRPCSSVSVALPPPSGRGAENVYDLSLSFDDGTVRTAKLGLIEGLTSDSEGWTRCTTPKDGPKWNRFYTRAVLPIPYGTTSLTVDGDSVETGLGGAQGWFALGDYAYGKAVPLRLCADGGRAFKANVVSSPFGMTIFFR